MKHYNLVEVTVGQLPEWYDNSSESVLENWIEGKWIGVSDEVKISFAEGGNNRVRGWQGNDCVLDRNEDLSAVFSRIERGYGSLSGQPNLVLDDQQKADFCMTAYRLIADDKISGSMSLSGIASVMAKKYNGVPVNKSTMNCQPGDYKRVVASLGEPEIEVVLQAMGK